jgi:hypothetical protein
VISSHEPISPNAPDESVSTCLMSACTIWSSLIVEISGGIPRLRIEARRSRRSACPDFHRHLPDEVDVAAHVGMPGVTMQAMPAFFAVTSSSGDPIDRRERGRAGAEARLFRDPRRRRAAA